MPVRELDSAPNLAVLYGKAALTSLSGGGDLPDTELVLKDVDVDREDLAAYNRVCGFRVGDDLPVTYPHVVAFPLAVEIMSERSFPFALPGLVHIRNRIEQVRPIHADEQLTFRVWTQGLRDHPKGRQFDVVAEVTSGGQPVWTGTSTYLKRGGGSGSGGSPREALPEDARAATWKLPADTGRRYAAVSGDRNPIHLHPLTARLFGFPRQIAHGMWTKARCVAALEGRLPETFVVDAEFKKPVILPATVAFASTRDGEDWRFTLTDARSGSPHLLGSITAT